MALLASGADSTTCRQ
jgi:hypothetical protein